MIERQCTWNDTYDFENQLMSIKKNGVVQNRFWYDAQGRRVRLWDSQIGYLTQVYLGLDIIFENSSSGYTKHFYANGLHIAENRSGTIEYYHQDHLGSTRLKTNSTGGIVFSTNYKPFGPSYAEIGTEEFKYTGKYEDTSGLYYYGARYYDPDVARFITEDPILGDLEDPQSLNRYTYCRNNPLKYTDPDGRVANIVIGGLVGGALGFASYLFTHWGRDFDIKEALIETASGAVMGMLTSIAGPGASLAMKAFMTTSAASISWAIENTARVASGLPTGPKRPDVIAQEIVTNIATSLVVGKIVEKLVPHASNILSEVISREVPVYYSYPQETAPLEELVARAATTGITTTIMRYFSRTVGVHEPDAKVDNLANLQSSVRYRYSERCRPM